MREQCMAVIMSALLLQWSVRPDQLHDTLPNYVPTTVKQSIIDALKVHKSIT